MRQHTPTPGLLSSYLLDTTLADALFTKTQQRVLGAIFGQPERSFYASELIRDAGTGSGAAQRELARLEGSGLIVARRIGHQKHYQANAASPLFSELTNIVLKTVGLAEPLRDALKSLSSAIRAAFVYGSVAKATDQSASDIDLMIISDSLPYGDVFGALERVTRSVGRKVDPTVYTAAEFSKRAGTENAFVTRVRASGWRVELIYLALPNPEMAKLRVAERVSHGGHDIPVPDIERRFFRSWENLTEICAALVDRTICFLNISETPEVVFTQQGEHRDVLRPVVMRLIQSRRRS